MPVSKWQEEKVKIEIEEIKNGWVVTHDLKSCIWNEELYFKSLKKATAYCRRILKRYGETYG